MCKSFLDHVWNGSHLEGQTNGHLYDTCGLIDPDGAAIMPAAHFRGANGAESFLRRLTPPSFDFTGFDFVVVDDVESTESACSLCRIEHGMCFDCPNGCTYNHITRTCRGFHHQYTPCFRGEDTDLPGKMDMSAAPLQPMAVSFVLLFAFLL